jgi:hypothetical protein
MITCKKHRQKIFSAKVAPSNVAAACFEATRLSMQIIICCKPSPNVPAGAILRTARCATKPTATPHAVLKHASRAVLEAYTNRTANSKSAIL